jgi:opacity protein-like surface antigen
MTGGGAWTSVDTTLLANCPTGCGNLSGAAFGTGAFTDGKSGWTAGGGIEVMLTGNLTAKVEYLHLAFGTISHAVIAGPTVQTVALNNRLREDLVRFGLNYKFDYAAAPATYK